MKRGMLLLFFAMIILSCIAYAEDMVFEAEEVGKTARNLLPNGDVQLVYNNKVVTQYNPAELRKFFDVAESADILELSLRKKYVGSIRGRVKVDAKDRAVVVESPSKDSIELYRRDAKPENAYSFYGRKIAIRPTAESDVLVSLAGESNKSINVTVAGKMNIYACRDENCRFDFFARLNPQNANKYILNITGNAYLAKDVAGARQRKEYVSEGNNIHADLNISDISVLKFSDAGLYHAIIADASLPTSSFGEVNFVGGGVDLRHAHYSSQVSDASASVSVFYPSIAGKSLNISRNNADRLLISKSGSLSSGKINYFHNGRELFSIISGRMHVFKNYNPYIEGWMAQASSYLFLSGDKMSISIRKGTPEAVLNLKPSHPSFNMLDFKLFGTTDTKSHAYIENPNNAGGKIMFAFDNVLVTPNSKWHDFGYSFKIPIYDSSIQIKDPNVANLKEGSYSILECRLQDRKCYLNGKEVSSYTQQKAVKCRIDSDCKNQSCLNGLCVTGSQCKKLNVPGMNGPIGLLFMNHGAVPKENFVDYIYKITGAQKVTSGTQFFAKEPFKSIKGKYTLYYMDSADLPLGTYKGSPMITLTKTFAQKFCHGARHFVIVSGSDFGSFASSKDGRVFASRNDINLFPNSLSHEYAHACCGIEDEYFFEVSDSAQTGYSSMYYNTFNRPGANCARDAADASSKNWPSSVIAQATNGKWQGCGGNCPTGCSNWLKPSKESIMSKAGLYGDFNSVTVQAMRRTLV